ncbi:MAG: hypothetical protein AAB573_05490 [Patescibacteria group bacterium]
MENSPIRVQELDASTGKGMAHSMRPQFETGGSTPKARLVEDAVNAAYRSQALQARKRYKLNWTGSNIPRGAKVGEHIIAHTQNGEVVTAEGGVVGTYERTVPSGGVARNEQEMIVYITK